jgi:hypothetical protein
MAAGKTYESITTRTLSSDVNTVTINNIPSTYTDLIVIIKGRTSTQNLVDCSWRVNGDSAGNYSHTRWVVDGNGNYSDQAGNQSSANASGIGYGQGVAIWQFLNYSNTTTYKTALMRASFQTNSLGMYMINGIGMWRSTSAINELTLFIPAGQSGTFVTGMTISLYGIKAA